MRLRTGYETRRARFEIVPLMDVIFLLLSSFIYATLPMTAYRGLKVQLPYGTGNPEQARTVIIVIAADNTLRIGEREVEMPQAVREAAARAGKDPVLVSGDKNADLGVAIELLSELRKAGVESVSFQTEERRR